ncbi:MAG: hypothetical protein J6C82_05080 [Clostridia bacterium]|nr:hypothetical protein [Clostridia bacterium]
MGRQDDIMRAERARTGNYGQDRGNTIEIPCPICGGHDFDFVIKDKNGDIVGCESCCNRIYYDDLKEGAEFG